MITADRRLLFEETAAALHRGDFSWLAPLFEAGSDGPPPVMRWVAEGRFAADKGALHEALACACFLGQTEVAEHLIDAGADLLAGAETGMNGFHWAANRGQLATVHALIARGFPLETRNRFGGTVLGGTVWSAVHEPRPAHLAIIEALLAAGADISQVDYPSGNAAVDECLERHGIRSRDH